MNEGMGLVSLAQELERQIKERKDYVAPVKKLFFEPAPGDKGVTLHGLPEVEAAPLTSWADSQVRTFFDIPARYYNRMAEEDAGLLAFNLNRWTQHQRYATAKRLVRTLDRGVRAWVSDSYRALDNYDLVAATLPILKEKAALVRSSTVTDTRLYLKATLPGLEAPVEKSRTKGDVLRGGVLIRNSEVGNGALTIAFFVERLVCTNGMISESLLRKTHLGKRIGTDVEEAVAMFSSKTRRLDDAAFFSKVSDVLKGTLAQEYLDSVIAKANGAAEDRIEKESALEEVIEVTASRFQLPENVRRPILHNLIEGGDLSRWGLANAFTLEAERVEDYEVATALEAAGGEIIDLTPRDWTEINKKAA